MTTTYSIESDPNDFLDMLDPSLRLLDRPVPLPAGVDRMAVTALMVSAAWLIGVVALAPIAIALLRLSRT